MRAHGATYRGAIFLHVALALESMNGMKTIFKRQDAHLFYFGL